MARLKQLLLITYYYPPAPEAGALRPAYLAKHLPNYGWTTTIITPRPGPINARPNDDTVTARVRKVLSSITLARYSYRLLRNFFFFPDAGIFWLPSALRQATTKLQHGRFDIVMSTALPASMHIIGSLIRRKYRIPWLADFRDLWTTNPYRRFGRLRLALERRLERSALANADVITAVSESLIGPLRAVAPQARCYAIPNAFDPSDWEQIECVRPSEFRFCFGGRLYNGQRSPELLFAAVADLKSSGDASGAAARFDFFGSDVDTISALAARYCLQSVVSVHGLVPRQEMLKAERAAAVLLLLLNRNETTSGEYGSKVYEYMGAGRPILAIGGEQSVVKDLLTTTGLGLYASDVETCKKAIKALFFSYTAGLTMCTPLQNLAPFTADRLAAQFSTVLNTMVDNSVVYS